jgi:photosystem II stability/assembly factor-like uncharacterized protein
MDFFCYLHRLCRGLLIAGLFVINSAYAHYPHDIHSFVEMSPDYANDNTAFIASKQASSTRPVTALVSRTGGATWEFNAEGMDNLGKITSATASPLYEIDNTVILTSQGDGVYRTVDEGLTWSKYNQGLAKKDLHDSVAAIDNTGGVSYFVTATYGGLYLSTQQDTSWSQKLDETVLVTAIAVSPDYASDQTLITGTPDGILYLSNDAGENFTQLNLLNGTGIITQIHFAEDYASSGEVFIGTSTGLYVSTDYLTTVTPVAGFSDQLISALVLSPAYRTDATLFVTTPTQGVFKSGDRGQSWMLHGTGVELVAQTDYHFHELNISRSYSTDGTLFLATFEGLFRSTDFGNTWVEMETRPPSLVMSVAMSPHFALDSLLLVSTYGGGMYVSEDAGQNWRVSNRGISSPYGYQVDIVDYPYPGADMVMVSSHSSHLVYSVDKGNNWVEKEISGEVPAKCIASIMGVSPDFATDTTVYFGCRKDGIVVTHDAGESWSVVLDGASLAGGAITSIELSPDYAQDDMLMFSEHRGFFGKSLDEGLSWQLAQNGLPVPGKWYGGRGLFFSPDYINDRSIAAATQKGFFGTIDSASNWSVTSDFGSPVAHGAIQDIAFSPDFANDKTVLTSVRGEGLFRSVDNTLSWQQVAAGDAGSRYDIQGLVISPDFANDGLIIGYGHDHLLRSTDRGETFEPFDIPFTRHEDNRKQSVLYNGVWYPLENDMASGVSFRISITPGNEVSLMFEGTGVRWIGVLANVLGIAEVYLDDVLVATVDQYSETPSWMQTLYEVENLPRSTHEIRLVVTAEKNSNALAHWLVIDSFDVIK